MRSKLIAPDSEEAHQRILARIRAFTDEDFARIAARESEEDSQHRNAVGGLLLHVNDGEPEPPG